jgi:hypothetical protein
MISSPVFAALDLERLRTLADESSAQVYALIDGARDERIAPALRASGAAARCLFDGDLHPELAAAAPYLVSLTADSSFTATFVAEGWAHAWGVPLTAAAGLDELRRHFRRFLRVADEAGRPLLFRYYDPRVLRVYLPTCSASELDLVFGPVESYFIADESGQTERLRNFGGLLIRTAVDDRA